MIHPRTFVLVHGSFAGGWCWRPIVTLLEAEGHRVIAPSLTGLGDRSHLMSSSIGLETHILDIANIFDWEDLEDVVLVGHSYGGMVIGGVAQRQHRRISSLAFIDAIVPVLGTSIIGEGTNRVRQTIQRLWDEGNYHCSPPASAAADADQAWFNSKLTAHPIKTYLDESEATDRYDCVASKLFVRASRFSQVGIERSLERVTAWGWKTVILDCGHSIMQEQPYELARILLSELGEHGPS